MNLLNYVFNIAIFIVTICGAIYFIGSINGFNNHRSQDERVTLQGTNTTDNDLELLKEKAAKGTQNLFNAGFKAIHVASGMANTRPLIAIPDTAFAYLVEHLLGRGKQCPPQYDSFEKCLEKCTASELNRPIGIHYWVKENGIWTVKNVDTENRTDNGPTYNVLYFTKDNPPANAISFETTALALSSANQVDLLVKSGAKTEIYYGSEGQTALIGAIIKSDIRKIEKLLSVGADKYNGSALQGQRPSNFININHDESVQKKILELLK